jgi:hypothetical protein
MTVGELLARMHSREITEWKAYFILENEDQEEKGMIAAVESGAESRRWSR